MNIQPFKNRELDLDQPVYVYRCLTRKGVVYSIKQKDKVVAHTSDFLLENCKFIINRSGKLRTISEKIRNVHAYIKGYLVLNKEHPHTSGTYALRYNPFEDEGFYTVMGEITEASMVFTSRGSVVVKI